MADYYLNIRARSKSKAPFNMWPHEFKFLLTKPTLIYQSVIESDGSIHTFVFPTLNNSRKELLGRLTEYSRTTTITDTSVKRIIHRYSPNKNLKYASKCDCLQVLEQLRTEMKIPNDDICDAFAEEIYLPQILPHRDDIPESIKRYYSELR